MKTTTPTTSNATKDHSYITKLPSFAERGKAIAQRLEEVKSNPKYTALSPEHQARVRADLYKKYVPTSYSGFHLPVPNEKDWVEATGGNTNLGTRGFAAPGQKDTKLSESYNDSSTKQFVDLLNVKADKAITGISLFGTRVANKAFSSIFGLNEHYTQAQDKMLQEKFPIYRNEKLVQQKLGNAIDAQRSRLQSDQFWEDSHLHGTIFNLATDSGEMVATLPLYEAVGALGIGAKVGQGLSLSSKLATSPVGKFVAKRLVNATDAYVATLVESGGDPTKALQGAAGVAAFESGAIGVGSGLKIAAAPLIKKWTANTIAMGGKPFAQDIAESASHEMRPVEWWLQNAERTGIKKYGNVHQLGNGITIFPESEATGHLVWNNESYKYEGPKQRQTLYNTLMSRADRQRTVQDSVVGKLHAAEKVSLDSIAMQKFNKSVAELTDDEHTSVLVARHELIEDAAEEAPVHLHELTQNEVEHTIDSARKQMPELNAKMSEYEKKYGAKFVETQTANDLTAVAKETGISNSNAAAKKSIKVAKATKSASLSPKDFASHNSSSIAYFTAPRNRKALGDAISDRSSAGFDKFYDLLRQADGDKIKFETPLQRMLYHYGNRKDLPKGFSQSLLYRIRQTKGYENLPAKDIARESDWFHAHLLDMAHSGHLESEGNTYASTKLSGPMSWTKWQRILSKESDQAILKPAMDAFKQHPQAMRGFKTAVKALQKTSTNIKTPEEYIAYKRALGDTSSRFLGNIKPNNTSNGIF